MQPCQLTPTDTCTWFITHPAWKALARVSLNVGFKAVLASTLNDCFWPAATSRERLKSARSGRTTPTINPPFARETCVEAHSLSPALESIYEPIQRNALRSFLSPLSLLPSSSHQSCPPHAPDRSLLLRFLALPYSFAPPVRQSRPCRRGKATGGGHQRLPRPTAALRGAHGPSLDAAGSEVEPGLADRLWRRHAGDVEGFRLSGGVCADYPSGQRFAAAPPLTWNADLGTAAQGHSQAMANDNYFAHQDPNGDMPWDRAKAAGYGGRQIGENIAAGQRSPGKAMEGWLASPGHCANLMSPMFTQVGAASAANSRSDNGVYWTMLFGAK